MKTPTKVCGNVLGRAWTFVREKGEKTMAEAEENYELPHDVSMARFIVTEVQRVLSLHAELAHYYRSRSRDKATITLLWQKIDEGEAGLRVMGVAL